jgi:hypothetical protein
MVESAAMREAKSRVCRPTWGHDQFACGRRFRVLNIVDDVTRE